MENSVNLKPTYKTNPMAIASLVLSTGGFSFLPLIGSIAGIVTGAIARREIAAKPDVYDGEGLAKAGIILGWIGVALPFLILLLGLLFFIPASFVLQ
ncbi:MAG: DUF4190 domain-containing protein [Chloroflexota bacterium]